MPYSWKTEPGTSQPAELHLWPNQSLPAGGYAGFILGTFLLILIPLLPLLGSVVLWGLLPFLMIAIGGMWLALDRNRRNSQILEVLTLDDQHAHLVRHAPKSEPREWQCNRYWATVHMHEKGGPVPYYVTLKGANREVEIGAFLSEDERRTLFDDLSRALRR